MNNGCKYTNNNRFQKPENGFINSVLKKQETLLAVFSINSFRQNELEIIFANIRV
ncbi:hypothetical protein SAMN02745938_101135 [Flavobacterium psychrophilum DSM 3660]|nr:hypothetical protein SAMN02745938_101135 [Flavobacterium psychrophilum DSM 3660] [Flavobacterium psychrophilum DSM 3660 = ATCC 49418]SNB07660.1 hypothetical protein JIP1600_1530007 [Flavobacterium psychrophilum]GAQ48141.1 hypothetical protein FPK15_contig00005-0058 [Flavobacterium psychrophilum]GAW89236.1 hypothetical protein FPS14_contig00017-0044 [Flavobacterium psychrophilum]GEJ30958.1 hypothetical protein FPN181_contig00053-0007 [Flavobacterium psychrophilum]